MIDDPNEKYEQYDTNHDKDDPEVPNIAPLPKEHHQTNETYAASHHYIKRAKEYLRERWPSAGTWTAIFTLGILVATWVYAKYAGGQWQTMNSQLGEMKRASSANEKAAKAAEQAVNMAVEQFRADQRAWIGVGNIYGSPELNQVWKVTVVYHNSGKTPAKNIAGHALVNPVNKGGRPNFDYGRDKGITGGMIPPNGDYSTAVVPTRENSSSGPEAPVVKPMLDALNGDQITVYFHGMITYDDVSNCHHWMTYCYFWDHNLNGFAACRVHNDTGDDPCQQAHQ